MNTVTLDGALFARMVKSGAANLNRRRTIVNELNVFPIPDGDTGDNMYMTIHSGSDAATGTQETLDKTAGAIAQGMLLGARGNSGVILSRIFAGIARGLRGEGAANVRAFGEALSCGVQEAYDAVATPVEGTILTVYRDAVDFANANLSDKSTLEEYFHDFVGELRASLDRTPDLLKVLRDAGVVDSGGAGFVYIAEGMKYALDGEDVAEETERENAPGAPQADLNAFGEDDVLQFGYCTEFMLRLTNAKTGGVQTFDESVITDRLRSMGDSVVAFREGSILKVHVHTMSPGEILSFAQQYGEFLTLKIENMMIQHENTTVRNGYREDSYEVKKRRVHKRYATVAVASGEGLKETFRSLGTDAVIDGGQSMNPCAQDFLDAFRKIDADTILVFPNNSNIILTADQAAHLYRDADVRVIHSTTVGEGYAALSMLDTEGGDTDAILAQIDEVIGATVTGEVSRAVRDTERDGVVIREGDYIGFCRDTVYTDCKTPEQACLSLAEQLHAADYDVCLLLCGRDSTPACARELYDTLQSIAPRTEIIMIDGAQPVFEYILILE